jgi:hypothetical protein
MAECLLAKSWTAKSLVGIFYNHGWRKLSRMGELAYWQPRVREDWGVPTNRLLEWHGLSREAGLAEKNRNSASSLAGCLLFLRPIRPASASKPLFIREHPCPPWFIFSLQPRSARSLLKLEQLTLCALGVLCGQNAFG